MLGCGGRDYADKKFVFATLDELHAMYEFTLAIHGNARGADKLVDAWARKRGVQPVSCEALWSFHGRSAGPRRNGAMTLLRPKLVVAFPGGTGTQDMIDRALSLRIPVIRAR